MICRPAGDPLRVPAGRLGRKHVARVTVLLYSDCLERAPRALVAACLPDLRRRSDSHAAVVFPCEAFSLLTSCVSCAAGFAAGPRHIIPVRSSGRSGLCGTAAHAGFDLASPNRSRVFVAASRANAASRRTAMSCICFVLHNEERLGPLCVWPACRDGDSMLQWQAAALGARCSSRRLPLPPFVFVSARLPALRSPRLCEGPCGCAWLAVTATRCFSGRPLL